MRSTHFDFSLPWFWRSVGVGAGVFGCWVGFGHLVLVPASKPSGLSSLPAALGGAWIACRVLTSVIAVPIAEELAYRGYLMRRLIRPDFEAVVFDQVHWPAIALCAVAFGITHGSMWLPAVLAGYGYGALVVKTGKMGEALIAHAITNGLLAAYVLAFGQWQLW